MTSFESWARAVLNLYGLNLVVIDTDSLKRGAKIISFLSMDATGDVWSTLIRPEGEIEPNTAYTGITQEELEKAPLLVEVWPQIYENLRGSFCIASNFDWFAEMLAANAAQHNLPPIPVVGDSLLHAAAEYLRTGYMLSLAAADERIGHKLPQPATALDRAVGMLRLLEAMTAGITSVQEAIEDATPEIDEHPF